MYGLMKMYMLFIGSNIIIVASMSNFHSEKHSNHTSTTAESGVSFNRNGQRNIDTAERMRRLIPYMTFYIPTSSREYLPTSPYAPVNKPMNPYLYHESATLPTNRNNAPQHLYLPSADGPVIRKPSSSLSSSPSRIPTYNVDDKLKKLTKIPQKITKNVFVTPLVDVVIPQQSYQLNGEVYNNEQAGKQLIRPGVYLNDNRGGNNLTPFLASNQVPGPFRPIITVKNYTHDFPNNNKLNNPNHIRYSNLKESLPIALTHNRQQQQQQQQQQQHQQQQYVQPQPLPHIQTYYVASTSSTEQPIANNGIDDSIQQVYLIEPIVKPEINGQKTIIKQNYNAQQGQQRYKQIPNTIQSTKVTKISYDLDPDDGYGGRVLLPYESYYTKDYKSVPHIQSTVEPTYLQKPTVKPLNTDYDYKLDESINGFEPAVSYDPYKISVTEQHTHQHLTETTPVIQPLPSKYFHPNNVTTIEKKPSLTYSDFIPTTSPKPLHEILHNMNKTSLQLLLTKLKENNYLPKTFTMNKFDNSLKTLSKVLGDLKKTQKLVKNYEYPFASQLAPHPPQKLQPIIKGNYEHMKPIQPIKNNRVPGSGTPGIDFPAYSVIPKTNFNCSEQRYKGFFGDPEAGCQAWHYCDLNGGQASFLCPNGTIFSQVLLTCDWWFNVKCSATAQLYVLNERLYKYILPLNPKFPEDYSGPLVDKYLAIKFQEMEEKMQRERNKNRVKNNEDDDDSTDITPTEDTTLTSDTDTLQTETVSTEDPLIITADTEPTTPDQRNYYQTTTFIPPILPPLPPPPKFHVESERAEVIEIRSDGSSGHLIPGRT
ncbi:uncharacterized protein LOC129574799 isoform X2 [Sitodiplosis mosellana]|uniref:uncharacterized protein LOC129574799 isoform X2 n=1 Tax=Sitodiplosis mosellana TaxID=263140 RepID=UPI0024444C16|nr:uncharacterized protein LOC129574799 isoform X2 [Sitodiplosis mosellana]